MIRDSPSLVPVVCTSKLGNNQGTPPSTGEILEGGDCHNENKLVPIPLWLYLDNYTSDLAIITVSLAYT